MMFLRIFKHLLPNARAWRITVDKKLRQFFAGLSGVGDDVKTFFDNIWLDIFPQTTRELDAWDQQFGLRDTGLTEQQRRDRLDATWKALGGQDPQYIQDTLQANGFDVYVHEWWIPGSEPPVGRKFTDVTLKSECGESISECGESIANCGDSILTESGVRWCATPRNPLQYLRREFTGVTLLVECGEVDAACGEVFAQAGNSIEPRGYPLVNKIFETVPDTIPLCGESVAEAGEPSALCGNYLEFKDTIREYIVPDDPTKWPYFLYIGGETFGTLAQVDPNRRDEFEALCLKISPSQQWLGILVEYV